MHPFENIRTGIKNRLGPTITERTTDQAALPLLLLRGCDRAAIDTTTRIQKLVFLTQAETTVPQLFEFESNGYGPFSTELYATLTELETRSLVHRSTVPTRGGNEKHLYEITDTGSDVVEALLDGSDDNHYRTLLDECERVKSECNDVPIVQLLRYVQENHPETFETDEISI